MMFKLMLGQGNGDAFRIAANYHFAAKRLGLTFIELSPMPNTKDAK